MAGKNHLKKLSDLIPDDKNANRGTVRGREMLEQSLEELGAGRSVLIDQKGQVIAGNKTLEAARALGYEDVVVVPTDGKTLVAVQRTDLDLQKDPEARELAIADNRVGEVSLDWDPDVLSELSKEVDLSGMFMPDELEAIITDQAEKSPVLRDVELKPPPGMLWVLIGVNVNKFGAVRDHLNALESAGEIIVKTTRDAKETAAK